MNYKVLVCFLFLIFFINVGSASIEITDPSNGGGDVPVLRKDFNVEVKIIDNNISNVYVKVKGYDWVKLEQDTNTLWSGKLLINDYDNGDTKLIARYYNGTTTIFIDTPIDIVISKVPNVTQHGSVQFTIKDTRNNAIQGALVQPSNNISDINGIVLIGGQVIGTSVNFTITKSNYNTTYSIVNFVNNVTINQGVVMSKTIPDLKRFKVSGFSDAVEQNNMFYIKVRDDTTDELINGANVMLYQGDVVRSVPGLTNNGGRLTVTFGGSGNYEMTISKECYEDWSESVYVVPVVVTPTPIPIPTPTPDLNKYRADANLKLTDDEYREWMVVQEGIKRNQTLIQNNLTVPVVQKQDNFPWTFLIFGLICVGTVVYKSKGLIRKVNDKSDNLVNDNNEVINFDFPKRTVVSCDKCDWKIEVSNDTGKTIIDSILKSHIEEKHKTINDIVKEEKK